MATPLEAPDAPTDEPGEPFRRAVYANLGASDRVRYYSISERLYAAQRYPMSQLPVGTLERLQAEHDQLTRRAQARIRKTRAMGVACFGEIERLKQAQKADAEDSAQAEGQR